MKTRSGNNTSPPPGSSGAVAAAMTTPLQSESVGSGRSAVGTASTQPADAPATADRNASSRRGSSSVQTAVGAPMVANVAMTSLRIASAPPSSFRTTTSGAVELVVPGAGVAVVSTDVVEDVGAVVAVGGVVAAGAVVAGALVPAAAASSIIRVTSSGISTVTAPAEGCADSASLSAVAPSEAGAPVAGAASATTTSWTVALVGGGVPMATTVVVPHCPNRSSTLPTETASAASDALAAVVGIAGSGRSGRIGRSIGGRGSRVTGWADTGVDDHDRCRQLAGQGRGLVEAWPGGFVDGHHHRRRRDGHGQGRTSDLVNRPAQVHVRPGGHGRRRCGCPAAGSCAIGGAVGATREDATTTARVLTGHPVGAPQDAHRQHDQANDQGNAAACPTGVATCHQVDVGPGPPVPSTPSASRSEYHCQAIQATPTATNGRRRTGGAYLHALRTTGTAAIMAGMSIEGPWFSGGSGYRRGRDFGRGATGHSRPGCRPSERSW